VCFIAIDRLFTFGAGGFWFDTHRVQFFRRMNQKHNKHGTPRKKPGGQSFIENGILEKNRLKAKWILHFGPNRLNTL